MTSSNKTEIKFPAGSRISLFVKCIRTGSKAHPVSHSWLKGNVSTGFKTAGALS